LRPAVMMGEIYRALLGRMRADGFRVFDRRYSVPKGKKLMILLKFLFAGWGKGE
jgi:15-cis-phytoene synthase